MRRKINLRQQRHVGGADRISERLLIATFWVWGGLQADPVAMRADHLCSMLKARIEHLGSVRLTEIESPCAHLNGNSDILSRNIAGEERACNYGGGKDGTGTHDSCLGVHVNLLMIRVDNRLGS